MRVLKEGKADYLKVDPDGYRAAVRDNKPHQMVSKLMTHKEAIERFVRDGDYLAYDCNYFQRGPSSLIREIIRQRKKQLWICGKFTYVHAHCWSSPDAPIASTSGSSASVRGLLARLRKKRSPLRILQCADDAAAQGRSDGRAVFSRAQLWRHRRF